MTDRIADWFLRHGATAGRVLGVLGILCAIAALSVCTSGCSGASYRAHAQAITVTSGGLAVAGTVADTARDAALDAVEAEHPAHGAERTAALEAEALRWRPLDARLEMIVPPPITAAMTRAELGKELRSHLSLAQAARCTTTCDHGSRCTLPPNHTGGHETEHGCIAYDPRPPSDAGLALALVIAAAALSAALSGCTGQSYRAHAQGITVTSRSASVVPALPGVVRGLVTTIGGVR